MITKQPATPLPWHTAQYGDGTIRGKDFGDGIGNLIAETAMQESPPAKAANAAYIAHACNAYPELVAALRYIAAGGEDWKDCARAARSALTAQGEER